MGRREAFGAICTTLAGCGFAAVIGAVTVSQPGSPYFRVLFFGGSAAAAIGFLGQIGLLLFRPKPPTAIGNAIDQRVTSNNQSGGITAHTVHAKPPQRALNDQWGQQIVSELTQYPKEGNYQVGAKAGDTEAYRLAEQVRDYMATNGYSVLELIASLQVMGPFVGHKIQPFKNVDGTPMGLMMVGIGEHPGS